MNNTLHTTHCTQHTTNNTLHTTHCTQHIALHMLHTTPSTQHNAHTHTTHIACNTLHTTHYTRHIAHNTIHTTHYTYCTTDTTHQHCHHYHHWCPKVSHKNFPAKGTQILPVQVWEIYHWLRKNLICGDSVTFTCECIFLSLSK